MNTKLCSSMQIISRNLFGSALLIIWKYELHGISLIFDLMFRTKPFTQWKIFWEWNEQNIKSSTKNTENIIALYNNLDNN